MVLCSQGDGVVVSVPLVRWQRFRYCMTGLTYNSTPSQHVSGELSDILEHGSLSKDLVGLRI